MTKSVMLIHKHNTALCVRRVHEPSTHAALVTSMIIKFVSYSFILLWTLVTHYTKEWTVNERNIIVTQTCVLIVLTWASQVVITASSLHACQESGQGEVLTLLPINTTHKMRLQEWEVLTSLWVPSAGPSSSVQYFPGKKYCIWIKY